MKLTNVVVLVADRLGAGYLGPYGNTWLETPALNRIASESLTVEFPLIDSPRIETVCDSYWNARHALGASIPADRPSLIESANRSGYHTVLVTDEPRVGSLADAGHFQECVAVPSDDRDAPAEDMADTRIARFFSTVIDQLEDCRAPYLLWMHAQAMQGPWDAPYELRCDFMDEDDPAPPRFVAPPQRIVSSDADPDELLGIQQAYAAQVVTFDTCLGLLWESLRQRSDWNDTLFCLTSPRGYPLGEHQIVGDARLRLYGELCQVPCFLRVPGLAWELRRAQRLIQPADIGATILDGIGQLDPNQRRWGSSLLQLYSPNRLPSAASVFHAAVAVEGRQRMLRTPGWMLLDDEERIELYAKPDDRWEVNEVSRRCRNDALQMQELLESFVVAAKANDRGLLRELPRELLAF